MASIVFDFLARTEKFDKAVENSKKTVADFAREMEARGKSVDRSFLQIEKSAKEAITEQKKLIKEIEADVKKLQKAVDDASYGTAKKNMVAELNAAKKALSEEQARLNDLQSIAISQNKEEETLQDRIIGSLGRWAAGLFTLGTAIKGFKEVIASSNSATEDWNATVSGAKGASQQFFQTFVPAAAQPFNIIKNITEGFKGAKELEMSIDLYEKSISSLGVLTAQEQKDLEELEEVWRNGSNSPKERSDALDKYVEKRKVLAKTELQIEKDLNEAIVKEITDRPSLKQTFSAYMAGGTALDAISEDDIKNFAQIYATNPEVVKKAEEYWKMITGMATVKEKDAAPKLKAEIEALIPVGMEWADVLNVARINASLNKKQIDSLSDSFKRMYQAQAGETTIDASTSRVRGFIENKEEKSDDQIKAAYAKLIADIAALKKGGMDRELEALKGQYDIDLETYKDNEEMKIALKEKYELDKFEIEKKYLKKTIDELKQAAEKLAKDNGINPYSITQRYLSGKSSSGVTQTNALSNGLFPSQATGQDQNVINAQLQKEYETRVKIVSTISEAVFQMTKMVDSSEEVQAAMEDTLNIWESVAKEDWTSAAMNFIDLILIALSEGERTLDDKLQVINDALIEYEKIVNKSDRYGGGKEAYEAYITGLKLEIEALQKQLDAMEGRVNKDSPNYTRRLELLNDLNDKLEKAQEEYNDLLTGGITQNIIADAVANGFIEGGKNGIDTVANYMGNVLKNAAQEIFKGSILNDPAMQQYIDYAKEALVGGVLSPEEKAKLDQMAKQMAEKWGPAWESIMGSFETMGQAGGLTGAIKGVTEDTASELAGILRGVRDDVRKSNAFDRMGTEHLARIEANTANTVTELQKTNTKLDIVINNTKPVLAGDL